MKVKDPAALRRKRQNRKYSQRDLAFLVKRTLSDTKTALMDVIEGWDVPPRQRTADEHWRERLVQLMAFVAEHGYWPRYSRHETEHERILGVWLHTQHQARTEGRLQDWRLDALDAAVPGWRSVL